jgi:hypothetical protein
VADKRPEFVLLWIASTGALAASEAVHRVEYTYPNIQKHMVWAVWMEGLETTVSPVPLNDGICEDAHVSPNFLVILLREFSASVAWPVSCEDGTSDCIIRESVGTNANQYWTRSCTK